MRGACEFTGFCSCWGARVGITTAEPWVAGRTRNRAVGGQSPAESRTDGGPGSRARLGGSTDLEENSSESRRGSGGHRSSYGDRRAMDRGHECLGAQQRGGARKMGSGNGLLTQKGLPVAFAWGGGGVFLPVPDLKFRLFWKTFSNPPPPLLSGTYM